MIAVIPIFLEKNDELWRTAEGKTLIQNSFQSAVNASEIEKVVVFTNDSSIFNLSKPFDFYSYMIDIDTETQQSELLPLGTYSSIKYLQETIKLNFEELMILSYRNPLITSDSIDEAVNKFMNSMAPALISVKKSIDHPCQLNAYYKTIDIDFIHMFDDNEAIAPYLHLLDYHFPTKSHINQRNPSNQSYNQRFRLTKPFHFDWLSRGVQEKSELGIYVREYDDLNMQYVPIDQACADTSDEIPFPLWVYDAHNAARILSRFDKYKNLDDFPPEIHQAPSPKTGGGEKEEGVSIFRWALSGASFSDDVNHAGSLLFRNLNMDKYSLLVDSERLSSETCLVRILPVGSSMSLNDGIMEIQVSDLSNAISFQYEDKDLCGIIYCILKVAEDDNYDLCEPFPPDERLWTGFVRKINTNSGKEILGRQDFPEVFEPEGTFAIMQKPVISTFDREVLDGNAVGLIMEESNSIQIKSNFDLLRYKAIMSAIGQRGYLINSSV